MHATVATTVALRTSSATQEAPMPIPEESGDASEGLAGVATLREVAGMPPVNPRDRERQAPGGWRGLAGLAADVDYYGGGCGTRGARADGEAAGRCAVLGLADLVRQSRPYVVHDDRPLFDGQLSPYATVERDVAAYADAIIKCLTRVVDACGGEDDPATGHHTFRRSGAIQPLALILP
jgi:hypothetical protein